MGRACGRLSDHTLSHGFDGLVTLDCDGQHEPSLIPELAAGWTRPTSSPAAATCASSTRARSLPRSGGGSTSRSRAGSTSASGLHLTDAFCGFKAYRRSALEHFDITDDGYAMPLQVWVQAVQHGLKIVEVPVPLIYLDENRAFGGSLDDSTYRLNHYRQVFQDALRTAGLDVAGGCRR